MLSLCVWHDFSCVITVLMFPIKHLCQLPLSEVAMLSLCVWHDFSCVITVLMFPIKHLCQLPLSEVAMLSLCVWHDFSCVITVLMFPIKHLCQLPLSEVAMLSLCVWHDFSCVIKVLMFPIKHLCQLPLSEVAMLSLCVTWLQLCDNGVDVSRQTSLSAATLRGSYVVSLCVWHDFSCVITVMMFPIKRLSQLPLSEVAMLSSCVCDMTSVVW